MKMVQCLLGCLALGWILVASASAGPRDLMAQSDDDRLWIARVEHVTEGQSVYEHTRLLYRNFFEQAWLNGPIVPARVVSIASANGQLLLALSNGQWMIASPDDLRLGAPLPLQGRMVLIAADKNIAWALVAVSDSTQPATGSSTRLATLPSTFIALSGDTTLVLPTTTLSFPLPMAMEAFPATRATQPASRSLPDHLLLYRMNAGQWIDPRDVPEGLVDDPSRLSMSVAAGKPVIAMQTSEHSIAVSRWAESKSWSPPRIIAISPEIANFKLLTIQDHVDLWVQPAVSAVEPPPASDSGAGLPTGGAAVNVTAQPDADEIFVNADLSRMLPLRISNVMLAPGAPRIVAVAPSNLHWIANLNGNLVDRAYNYDFKPQTEVMHIATDQPPEVPVDTCVIAAVGVLVFASIAAFSQRRARGPVSAPIEQIKLRLAPPGARIAAGLVDLLPVAAAFTIIRQALPNGDLPWPPDHRLVIVAVVAVATHLLHTLISELICGQSIGKILFGLRVIGADGKPPRPLAILIRNVLRLPDYVILTLSMAIFTPLHQRLGDVAGKTIVIANDVAEETEEEEQH